jgi:TonB family protein
VVKQVVRASMDDEVESEPTPTTAATHSIVQQGSAGMMAANVIFSPAPEYPAAASAARVQGEVTVRAVVDPDGNVIYARVVSGPSLLRDAALEAVQRWRYRPLLYYGKPIAVTTTAILDFRFAR